MQAQPVVALAPGRARLGACLEHERPQALPAQERGGGEPGRAGADDRDVRLVHARGHTIARTSGGASTVLPA